IVGTSDSQTLTNKTISTTDNDISDTQFRVAEFGEDGNLTSSSVTTTELGYLSGVTDPIQDQLGGKQNADADLSALAALSGTGLAARTDSDTWATRTIEGTSNQISVSNGDGVAGNPAISLSSNPIIPGTAGIKVP